MLLFISNLYLASFLEIVKHFAFSLVLGSDVNFIKCSLKGTFAINYQDRVHRLAFSIKISVSHFIYLCIILPIYRLNRNGLTLSLCLITMVILIRSVVIKILAKPWHNTQVFISPKVILSSQLSYFNKQYFSISLLICTLYNLKFIIRQFIKNWEK